MVEDRSDGFSGHDYLRSLHAPNHVSLGHGLAIHRQFFHHPRIFARATKDASERGRDTTDAILGTFRFVQSPARNNRHGYRRTGHLLGRGERERQRQHGSRQGPLRRARTYTGLHDTRPPPKTSAAQYSSLAEPASFDPASAKLLAPSLLERLLERSLVEKLTRRRGHNDLGEC